MIEITYWNSDTSFSLYVSGHAGYAERGQDIVCAGVSALTQTLAGNMDDLTDTYHIEAEDGKINISGDGEKALILFKSVVNGLLSIENTYPENIHCVRIQG